MNKTTLLSIIGILAIVAVGIFVAIKKDGRMANDQVAQDGTTTPDQAGKPSGKKMAFGDFVKQGGSYQCTVNQYIDSTYSATTEGQVYMHAGMMRGNYTTKTQGMTIDVSMIMRDGFAYSWTSLTPMGYKSPVTASGSNNASTGTSGAFGFNSELIGDYDCQPWTADTSLFTLPANITFQVMGN